MDYSVQSLHRLPVLNYGVSRKETAPKIGENYLGCTKNNIKENISRKEIFDVGQKTSNKKLKAKEQKHQLRRKSTNIKNVKEHLSVCSNYFKEFVQPINTLQRTNNKQHKNNSKRSSEIRFLFSSDQYKKNKRKKINQSLINNIYDLEDNCLCEYVKKELNKPHNINCEVPKEPKQNIRRSYTLSDFNCNNVCDSRSTLRYGCNGSTHFKVINFPNFDVTDEELEEINLKRGTITNCQCQTENEISIQKDEKVAVTTSNTQGDRRDCPAVSNQCDLKEVCIKSAQPKNEYKVKHDCCNTFKTLYNPIMLHENVIYVAKGVLRVVIFALALIIWSPCIVAIFFCWIVTYPLRPKHIHRSSRCKSKPAVKIHVHSKRTLHHSIQTCRGSNTWSPLSRGINWALKSIALSFGVLRSFLYLGKNNSELLCCPSKGKNRNKRCVMTSNPKHKYTLYYSRNKGWVMKSTQRTRRDNSSQCCKKCVRTVASEPHCSQLNNKCTGVNVSDWSRTHFARRSLSYPGRSRVSKRQQKVESYLPCCCHHKHRHLCTNTSSLPVHIKFLNPVCNKSNFRRRAYLKDSIQQTRKSVSSHKRTYKSLIKQDTSITFRMIGNTIYRCGKETVRSINRVICNVEKELWRNDICIGDPYVFTLREKPCFFIYKLCPSLYPVCLTTYKIYKNLCHFLLLVIFACVWCPLIGFCYMCYAVFCRPC